MTRLTILLCALALTAAAAAQNTQPIRVAPIQAAPQVQPAPAVDAAATTVVDEEPMQAIETVESLKAANKKLRESNRTLRAQNTELADRITQMTKHGGSLVRAYCANDDELSRSTAGDENNCQAAGYRCEPVSGLCRTTCQTSDHCGRNHTCDPVSHSCVDTTNGAPNSDG